MKRSILILCALLAACDVGDVTTNNNVTGADAGTMGMKDSGSGSGVTCTNASATPNPAHPHSAPVNPADPYNMGQNCLQSGCHGVPQGTGAQQYYAGGTIYKTTAGTAAAPGAYVSLGTAHTYADDHGNFYFPNPVTFPLGANSSTASDVCPTAHTMVEGIATGQCTSSACHGTGNTAGPMYAD